MSSLPVPAGRCVGEQRGANVSLPVRKGCCEPAAAGLQKAAVPSMPVPPWEAGSLGGEALWQQGVWLLQREDCLALGCAVQAAALKSLPC